MDLIPRDVLHEDVLIQLLLPRTLHRLPLRRREFREVSERGGAAGHGVQLGAEARVEGRVPVAHHTGQDIIFDHLGSDAEAACVAVHASDVGDEKVVEVGGLTAHLWI